MILFWLLTSQLNDFLNFKITLLEAMFHTEKWSASKAALICYSRRLITEAICLKHFSALG